MCRTIPLLCLAVLATAGVTRADDWSQWLGNDRTGVWNEDGIIDALPAKPKILWRTKIGGGYAGPAVVGDRVYVADRVLDEGEKDPTNPFSRTKSQGKERVLCLDAKTGKEAWKFEYPTRYTMAYPCGPRATPTVVGGKLYHLGAMGDLVCLDAKSGAKVWHKNFVEEFKANVPLWGFAACPLVVGDAVITLVAADPVVVAFHKDTGKELWRALKLESAEIGYCPPTSCKFGGTEQVVVWHPEAVVGLGLDGKQLWSYEWKVKANLTVSTPKQVGEKLFLTSFYNGCKMFDLSSGKPKVVFESGGPRLSEQPKNTDKLHSIMPTPVIDEKEGMIYGVCSYGELRGLDLKTGTRKWVDTTATGAGKEPVRWANAFLVPQPKGGKYFIFNELGELITAKLSPSGYEETSRAKILKPTGPLSGAFGKPRMVVWSHPAFADKTVYVRNDEEIVAVSVAK